MEVIEIDKKALFNLISKIYTEDEDVYFNNNVKYVISVLENFPFEDLCCPFMNLSRCYAQDEESEKRPCWCPLVEK